VRAEGQIYIRRLGPGDEDVLRALAEVDEPQTALLDDAATAFVAAFAGDEPIGFAFGYELPRRRGRPTIFFVYEIEVDAAWRGRGIGKWLLAELLGAVGNEAFVLTDHDNDAANALYASFGGVRRDVVEWDFPAAE
jgi:aminoglycoside 3-N-acetyltransferase I